MIYILVTNDRSSFPIFKNFYSSSNVYFSFNALRRFILVSTPALRCWIIVDSPLVRRGGVGGCEAEPRRVPQAPAHHIKVRSSLSGTGCSIFQVQDVPYFRYKMFYISGTACSIFQVQDVPYFRYRMLLHISGTEWCSIFQVHDVPYFRYRMFHISGTGCSIMVVVYLECSMIFLSPELSGLIFDLQRSVLICLLYVYTLYRTLSTAARGTRTLWSRRCWPRWTSPGRCRT